MIREAVPADRDVLMHMGIRFIRESAYKNQVGENPEQIQKVIGELLDGKGTILVAEVSGKVEGMIALVPFPHPLSGEFICGELVWWVNPEYRGGRLALALLKAAVTWSKGKGAKRLQMISPAKGSNAEKIYRRLGFDELETTYQVRL